MDDAPPEEMQTVVVVGLGMVGIAFIGKLLGLDTTQRYRVITCGEETHLAYNRVALTDYFQHRNIEKLYLESPDWYAKQDPRRFEFHTGETVVSLDPITHVVSTDAGRTIAYDHCVLATGSDATLPAYADTSIPGVFVYRNIGDVNGLLAYAEREGTHTKDSDVQAVVLGGGLLGLEAAKAVHDLPSVSGVTIVHRSAHPLSRQLDAQGGEIVLRRIEGMGVRFLGSTVAARLVTDPATGALAGLELADGAVLPCTLAVFASGITPRDAVARGAGLECAERGGVVVDDRLRTSAADVYAVGECASWRGNTYGLIAPGIEMADILAFNFTQARTDVGGFRAREMNNPDLSTKLKLMGVDVASFGDFFAEQRARTKKVATPAVVVDSASGTNDLNKHDASAPKKRHGGATVAADGLVEALTYRDPFGGVYKRYIFSADGKYLLGGMMVGDASDYVKLVALVKKKASLAQMAKVLEIPPSQFILGTRSGEDNGDDLDDDTQICSCHNVSKGQIVQCIKDGAQNVTDVKTKTKAGTGCGGCIPLMTNIVKAELKKAGIAVNNNLCPHFAISRADLFNVVMFKKLKTMPDVMAAVGVNPESIGCETCKPAVGSILSSLWNENIINPVHHANQDTNDRFLANIQRNGTFSVVPRIAAGEITPEKLIVLGQVAKKYGLYTKITGAQRVDLFGAERADLPSIWKELVDAGFESGHAYGKALRTYEFHSYAFVRFVGAERIVAQWLSDLKNDTKGKDFGLIATDKGWNIFVCGNAGATPRHATLLAADVPPSMVVRVLDRFLMYYIRTADKLMRTARWLENMEGGIEKLRKVILDDALGICGDLEREMGELVGTYFDEWKAVVDDPERQKRFRQFVNTTERVGHMEKIVERGQMRPANWSKTTPPLILRESDLATPKDQWKWRKLATVLDLIPNANGTTSAVVRYGDSQIAIYHVPQKGYFATQQMCPHRRAFVLDHGIVGDDPASGSLYISCPMHKRNFSLTTGECLNDESYGIITFDVKIEGDEVHLLLPEAEELDGVIGTAKWMVRQATAEMLDRGLEPNGESAIEIVGPGEGVLQAENGASAAGCRTSPACGDKKLDW